MSSFGTETFRWEKFSKYIKKNNQLTTLLMDFMCRNLKPEFVFPVVFCTLLLPCVSLKCLIIKVHYC